MPKDGFSLLPLLPESFEAICSFNAEVTHNTLDINRQKDVLTKIVTGPDKVCDLSFKGKRVGVGVIIDGCLNTHNSAELSILVRDNNVSAMDKILEWALPIIQKGERTTIDLPEWNGLNFPSDWISRQGFNIGYYMCEMEYQPKSEPLDLAPLPNQWKWEEYSKKYFSSYYETLRESFKEVPGSFILEEADCLERSETQSPKVELLLQGEEVVGFVRVQMKNQNEGELAILGRHPKYRGHNVGIHLVQRGLGTLNKLGATKIYLEVAAVNNQALALYERLGFVLTKKMVVYQKRKNSISA